ncbi:hypothetical protein [Flavobacterium johnsoniae]|uniref:Uncharacterized protein n=1 Tax=Flavobacterium johnsoniae (strain ATCC 17061 / DSM 2064 / JCM 8514 / BCRC 14874 / CCUG 350202 / NBRC 14942 / NCIMB 11054 / UW101) TaxID=376686 RepID=A5FGF6_FLAJ1|nr:hypothetical protein [Flavobacterium johnsoniae]ABQ05714.1 hypothetical protein Fjoh_2691 [Flavobacterium johnsoniae UW101]OXE95298.1 hypothetical protein B0A63_24870 [Flavobacterium johnsoniae UW101]WQG81451.1 hypothetical protein SR927_25985 [Flavobacterium johnsoniae UW101]SHM04608.1 hypothetical protein SAMN05444146_5249 [Flavobacterium johnsoniae]
MYSKLNIKNIIIGHKDSLVNVKNKSDYKKEFIYIPLLASTVLVLIKIPDNDVKNIFGICLSILIGLYLNILVLLISSISSENLKISFRQKKTRLALLKETLYNVSFSVYVSVKALIALFLSTILIVNIYSLNDLLCVLINKDFNFVIQLFLGFFLYKYTIDIFLILFMILKRINIIYSKEIDLENLRLNDLIYKEDHKDED